MRKLPTTLAFLACASLLALQLSGLHMHVDEHGYVGVPEAAHSHTHAAHHHAGAQHTGNDTTNFLEHSHDDDYEGAADVSIVDLLSGVTKLSIDFVPYASLLPLVVWQEEQAAPIFAVRILSGRYTRWRPPLRAPPRFS